MLAARVADHDERSDEDNIVVLHGANWADYERLLEMKGDTRAPRIAYLEGEIEIMAPSRWHEGLHSKIGRLIEVFCQENDIDFTPYGSWTLKEAPKARGVEPDECYVFGTDPVDDDDRPDLAIEVIWTSGGLDKLEIYRKLGVREVWIWRRNRLRAYALRGEQYEDVAKSEVLPGIDLDELAAHLDRQTASQAIREYRAALKKREG
jgi:Uma2 family endonuclease